MISYKAETVLWALNQRPKKSKDLQIITGYTDTEIREAVRELRLHQVPVCSGPKGFWIWNGEDDSWNQTKNNIKSRAKKLNELYTAMERVPLTGQVSIYESM